MPDLVMMLMTPPAVRPVSAVYRFVCTRTSAIASIDGLTPTVPMARSLLSMPSISWLFWLSARAVDRHRRGLTAIVRPGAAGERVGQRPRWRPGTSCTSRMKLRPLTGRSCTAFSLTSELSVDGVGLQQWRLAGDHTFSDTLPDRELAIDARAVAAREHDARVSAAWKPCSSIFTV